MSFIKDLIKNILFINTSNLSNIKSLENIIDLLACIVERAWDKNSKIINILKHSKSWWGMSCSKNLEKYRSFRSLANWKQFKKTVKNTKLLQQPLVTQGQMILQLAKLSSRLSSNKWGNYKRTRQGALTVFIYYIYTWLLVHATTIFIQPLSPCCYLMSYYSSTCVFLKATMLPTCALTSYL